MLGEILAVIVSFLFAASAVIAASVLRNTTPLKANTIRVLFASVFMFIIALAMGEISNVLALGPYVLLIIVLSSIVEHGIGDTCLYKSITLIGVSKAYIIAYTFPLITLFIGTLFLGEPFIMRYLLGAVIIFLGVIMVSVNRNREKIDNESTRGLLIAFAAAVSYAIGCTLVTVGLKNTSPIAANTVRYPLLFVILFLFVRPWKNKPKIEKRNVALLAISGLLGICIGVVLLMFSIKLIGVSRAAPLSSNSPVWATIMSSFLLKEKITWKILASALLVVVGIYFLA